MTRLHYLYDPLCGWCYGAAPLIQVARELLPVQAHAGGMMAGAQRRAVTAELRRFVVEHDRRIAAASGQPFGGAYLDGLLCDTGAVLDSEPPITAILAAEHVAQRGLDLLARLQRAHYVECMRIAEPEPLRALAVDIGIDGLAFERAFALAEGAVTQAHIDNSRALLGRLGASGFPTMALAQDDRMVVLDIGRYLGRPEAWRSLLAQKVTMSEAAPGGDFTGTLKGCAL
ncbi:DsbA family protein [Variovorax sp. ZT4R33]|uniref:DsbA family protein n=1 Tax=Variovorax sp. ZT4R33 TaxID=3443743 RepID=UPI003F45FBBA